jgi:hypothetical protein
MIPKISVEISKHGVERVLVQADSDSQAAAAHRLLARVQPELQALGRACSPRRRERQSATTEATSGHSD